MGLFLLFSTALHATALSYPVLFLPPRAETLFPVTVLPLEAQNGGGSGPAGREANQKDQAKRPRPERAREPVRTNSITPAKPQQQNRFDSALTATSDWPEGIALAPDLSAAMRGEVSLAGPAELAGAAGENSGHGKTTTGGNGDGTGDGTATGNGDGRGRTGVTYAYSPKPEYPESARREGREGTVVLRVLVDEEGRSKSLEVNRSSGFEALDQAAVETVRRWRFLSARHGDKRVASWVRIPIEFNLADAED
jgi:TonB family protein